MAGGDVRAALGGARRGRARGGGGAAGARRERHNRHRTGPDRHRAGPAPSGDTGSGTAGTRHRAGAAPRGHERRYRGDTGAWRGHRGDTGSGTAGTRALGEGSGRAADPIRSEHPRGDPLRSSRGSAGAAAAPALRQREAGGAPAVGIVLRVPPGCPFQSAALPPHPPAQALTVPRVRESSRGVVGGTAKAEPQHLLEGTDGAADAGCHGTPRNIGFPPVCFR